MSVSFLLACPGCALSSPGFFILSMIVGVSVTGTWFLRPFVARLKNEWGWPRLNGPRIVSLLLMLSGPAAMYYVGQRNYDLTRVAVCTGALVACVVFLWLRCCWLLEQLGVESALRQILFPGLLAPGILVVGTAAGNWVLGMLLIVPAWPALAVPHTIACAIVGVPLGLVVYGGLRYVFGEGGGRVEESGEEVVGDSGESQEAVEQIHPN